MRPLGTGLDAFRAQLRKRTRSFQEKVDFLQIELDSVRLKYDRSVLAHRSKLVAAGVSARSILCDKAGVIYSLHKTTT